MHRDAGAPRAGMSPGAAAAPLQLPRTIELPEEWRARLSNRLHGAEESTVALVPDADRPHVRSLFNQVKDDIMGLMRLLHHLVNNFVLESQGVVNELTRRHACELTALHAEIDTLTCAAAPRVASEPRQASVDLVRPTPTDAPSPSTLPPQQPHPATAATSPMSFGTRGASRGVSVSSGSAGTYSAETDSRSGSQGAAVPGASPPHAPRMPSVSGGVSEMMPAALSVRGGSVGNPSTAAPSPQATGRGGGSAAPANRYSEQVSAADDDYVCDEDVTFPFTRVPMPMPMPTGGNGHAVALADHMLAAPPPSAASTSPQLRRRSMSAAHAPLQYSPGTAADGEREEQDPTAAEEVQDMISTVHPAFASNNNRCAAGGPVRGRAAAQPHPNTAAGRRGRSSSVSASTAASKPPAAAAAGRPAAGKLRSRSGDRSTGGGDNVFARLAGGAAPAHRDRDRDRPQHGATVASPPAGGAGKPARGGRGSSDRGSRRLTEDEAWKRTRDRMAEKAAMRGAAPPPLPQDGEAAGAGAVTTQQHQRRRDVQQVQGSQRARSRPTTPTHGAHAGTRPATTPVTPASGRRERQQQHGAHDEGPYAGHRDYHAASPRGIGAAAHAALDFDATGAAAAAVPHDAHAHPYPQPAGAWGGHPPAPRTDGAGAPPGCPGSQVVAAQHVSPHNARGGGGEYGHQQQHQHPTYYAVDAAAPAAGGVALMPRSVPRDPGADPAHGGGGPAAAHPPPDAPRGETEPDEPPAPTPFPSWPSSTSALPVNRISHAAPSSTATLSMSASTSLAAAGAAHAHTPRGIGSAAASLSAPSSVASAILGNHAPGPRLGGYTHSTSSAYAAAPHSMVGGGVPAASLAPSGNGGSSGVPRGSAGAGRGFQSPVPPPPPGASRATGNPLSSPAPSRHASGVSSAGGAANVSAASGAVQGIDLYHSDGPLLAAAGGGGGGGSGTGLDDSLGGGADDGPRHPLPPGVTFESQYEAVKQREWAARQGIQLQQQQQPPPLQQQQQPPPPPDAAAYGTERGVLYHSMLQKIRSTYRNT